MILGPFFNNPYKMIKPHLITLFWAWLLMGYTSVWAQSSFTIKGKITADFPQLIKIEYLDQADSVVSQNGEFMFSGVAKHPALFRLSSKNMTSNKLAIKELFVEQGLVEINTSFQNLRLSSAKMQFSASQQIFDDYNKKFSFLVDMYRYTRDSLIDKKTADAKQKQKINVLSSKINAFEELYEKDFILQNKDNYVGAYYFYRYGANFMSENETDSVHKLFTSPMQKSFYLKDVERKLKYAKLLKEGTVVPPLVLLDQKGKQTPINPMFISKITLIDLWASWCAPCIETHATLKELHTKYSSRGLNIIGVSLDNNTENWLNYLKKSPLPWKNYLDSKGERGETNNIFNLVSGNGIPFFALVNNKGEYIKIGLEAEELEDFISKYLEK